ncbi:hypothetical protein VTJ49DRAFT_5049 [Mycothermus thermophilus]|uniref:ZZ-type domain-containing protein n=1 Tax=Humicola insolens TaxID=85995 RepID=A0ABR3V5D4_HUMIN
MDALIRDFLEHVTPLPPTIVHGAPSSPRPAAGGSDLRATYAVCCNNCDRTIPDAHYHCATCDDGDFDLCQDCVDRGVSCKGTNHWMIKRFVKDGVIINSTTERLAPKPKPKPHANPAPAPAPAPVPVAERIIPLFNDFVAMRTCNCCVADLPEAEFVHCTTCDDYDLCTSCFVKNKHGHHPGHAFVPVDTKARLPREVYLLLEPGRDVIHNAICDSCNLTIHGVRHKCLDCPDWDYCSICVRSAHDLHPGHRFAPIYEPLEYKARLQGAMFAPTHFGICCDGPLCVKNHTSSTYIVGDRYKCAVCNDTDFCASCEASPLNTHNRTHPLIKFKTPVRHVSVTTTGETHGRPLRTMGDRPSPSRSAGTCPFAQPNPSSPSVIRGVQTVVDVKPSEPVKEEKTEKVAPVAAPPAAAPKPVRDDELAASYIRDTVVDGTVFEPDHVFKQTWILRNTGHVAWPADCFVRFVSGDYMGSLASDHPAKTQDVQYSFQSAPCTTSIQPGEEFGFTVCLRSPPKPGRYTSYWRLSTKEGTLFGHRLWCDIAVKLKELSRPAAPAVERAEVKAEPEVQPEHSQMIFPKLEKESPTASVHQVVKTEEPVAVSTNPEEYDDCDDADWRDGDSEEGFLTDEEYDILDASDEEFNSALNGKKN